jgi:hypothetical protein
VRRYSTPPWTATPPCPTSTSPSCAVPTATRSAASWGSRGAVVVLDDPVRGRRHRRRGRPGRRRRRHPRHPGGLRLRAAGDRHRPLRGRVLGRLPAQGPTWLRLSRAGRPGRPGTT